MVSTLKDANINASCFELPKDKIQTAWVDPGYLSSIDYVVFYTTWLPLTDVFEVQVMAYDINNNSLGSPITLAKGSGCAITLPPLAIGENIITLAELGIVNSGQLGNFDHVLVTPQRFNPPPPITGEYLNYNTQVIGGTTPAESAPTLPCPPCQYCKPPTCDTAVMNDTSGSNKPITDTARITRTQ